MLIIITAFGYYAPPSTVTLNRPPPPSKGLADRTLGQ